MGAIFMGRVRNYGLASGVTKALEARLSEVSVWKSEEGPLVFIGRMEGRTTKRYSEIVKKDLQKVCIVESFSWFNE